jgi:hypothetical protein
MAVPGVLADVGSGEDNLLVPVCQPVPDILKDVIQGQIAFWPSDMGDHTEGAELTASLLNLDHRAGAALPAAGMVRDVSIPRSPEALNNLGETVFLVVAQGEVGDPRSLEPPGISLGVAADSHNQRLWALPPCCSQQLTRLAVSDVGDRAGIENVYVGFVD